MNCRALRIVWSGTMFRYGDCSSCTASACFNVPSNTGSPVVLTKSARRIESFTVSFCPPRNRQYNPPAITAANRSPATTTRAPLGTAGACVVSGPPLERNSADSCGANIPAREPDIGRDTASAEPLDRCEETGTSAPGGSSATILFPESVSRFSRCSSARISDACWYRSSRSFSSARLMIRSSSAGTSGFTRIGDVGARSRIA